MKTRLFLAFLGAACFLSSVIADCDLGGKKAVEENFPDILKDAGDSYVMGVEYSTPKAAETAYFKEYYEVLFKRGRVESHIKNLNKIYIYRAETEESWTLENHNCEFKNFSVTPDFLASDQTEWNHFTNGKKTTVGPSAMLKTAYDVWTKGDRTNVMAYMGESPELIRGEKAVFWRRCSNNKKNYIDYYFADQKDENPFDTGLGKKQVTPLRVSFYGVSESEMEELSEQHYDIMSFQHFIPPGFEPFQLPRGKNCSRAQGVEGPKTPDFSDNNLYIPAEVVYRKFKLGTEEDKDIYYNTLQFALDRQTKHLAYYYSEWRTSKDSPPEVFSPEYIIYDMNHAYEYKISFETGSCEIYRKSSYVPTYKLPKLAGELDLTNPYVLLPNNELSYLTTGKVRGMDVNIYEASVDNFVLGWDLYHEIVPKALITHSYLKSDELLETKTEVASALVQIELRLFRKDGTKDLITFNLYGFSTDIPRKQRVFDVTRCYRNDDDYSILTIGFEVEPGNLPKMPSALAEIEQSVISSITARSELNSVRIPYSMANIKKEFVFVTVIVLDKPDPQLDFTGMDDGKTVTVANIQDDTDGVANFKTCATNCLEERDSCWGFSMCGDKKSGTCYYGSETNTKVEAKTGCTLYTRFSNTTYMQSKELQIRELRSLVDAGEFMISVPIDGSEMIQLVASYSRVDDPAEDDTLFKNLGNKVNPRMKVQQAATKLKRGTEIKNMGKLAYDECQSLCLDFTQCETVSFCLKSSACVISTKYASDLKDDEKEADEFCILLSKKYTDHFDHTPGVFVKTSGGTSKDVKDVQECSRACLKETGFNCLSFDHCMLNDKQTCKLYSTHYLSRQDKADATEKNPRCGHYTKKFSNEFSRKDQTRLLGSKVAPVLNLTLEQCAKTCVDYGQGTCYGYDFCQDVTLFSSSCTLFDTDPSRLESTHSGVCTNYIRSGGLYEARPFTLGYAGGIGFLCFVVGGVLGAIVVFVIAYIRVNRSG